MAKLTQEQCNVLVNKLLDTSSNIYRVSEQLFGIKIEESDWDDLKKMGRIFRCEICSIWKIVDDESEHLDVCKDCMDDEEA